jgi:hypothetical protein
MSWLWSGEKEDVEPDEATREEAVAGGWFGWGGGKSPSEKKHEEAPNNSDDESDEEESRRDRKNHAVVWVTGDLMYDVRQGLKDGDSPYTQVFHVLQDEIYFGELPVRVAATASGGTYTPHTFTHELFLEFLESGAPPHALLALQEPSETEVQDGTVVDGVAQELSSQQQASGAHM